MRRPAALLLTPLLLIGLLAACGGGEDDADSASPPALPSVTGSFGDKPTVNLPANPAGGQKLQVKVLEEGDGPAVAKGDLMVADYLGQIFASGTVFDNSYDRSQPAAFQIGAGKVIPGWDKGLVGVKAGSRVAMVIPPADGYGTSGNPQAGIKGTDSLIFVVDVIASYPPGQAGTNSTPVTDLPSDLPKVTGELGSRPTIEVPKGTTPPTDPKLTVLSQGDGEKVVKNKLTIVQFDAVDWAGKQLSSSWDQGSPQGVPVGVKGQPGPFDLLVGVPAGSRVLLSLPSGEDNKNNPAQDSVAVVVDVLAQHGPAKEAS